MNFRLSFRFALLLLLLPFRLLATPPGPDTADFASAAKQLGVLTERLVADQSVVGAEVLVWHRGQILLHTAAGWRDRETAQTLQPDSLFAIRSMSKPLTGLAAQLLIEEGKLELEAPVARYLSSFDTPNSREILVHHLLTHRSGLPLVLPTVVDVEHAPSSLRALADRAGEVGPVFPPGERYLYSDAGSDVLGAIVEIVSGQNLEEFVQRRVLQPANVKEMIAEPRLSEGAPADRVVTRYVGWSGGWTRYWGAGDRPIYPFLKGSGGWYATAREYARFLQYWMDGYGERGGALPDVIRRRALTAVSRDVHVTGLAATTVDYGQMWMLFRPHGGSEAVGFGHSGSDGTLGYAFPREQLIICFFTQSRGTSALRTVEEAISALFLAPDPTAFAELLDRPTTGAWREFVGLYAREQNAASLGAVIEVNDRLAFELPNRKVLLLRPTADRDRWVPEQAPNDELEFRREHGRVVGFDLQVKGRSMAAERYAPPPNLPTIDEVLALRRQAVPPDRVQAMLPLRLTWKGESGGQTFTAELLLDEQRRTFTRLDFGAAGEFRVWTIGQRAWRRLPGQGAAVELHGLERAEEVSGCLAAQLGDWRDYFPEMVVVSQERRNDRDVLRVRCTPAGGFAKTNWLDAATGHVLEQAAISVPLGAAPLPIDTRYSDFRDVMNVSLAHVHAIRFPGTEAPPARMVLARAEMQAAIDAALKQEWGKLLAVPADPRPARGGTM